ncbi:Bidirectional sugar transporter SWEET2a, partial [Linum perenne]
SLNLAGNLCAFVLFVSPIPTFRRIIRNQSTEQFSGLPYIYSLLNCLICLWYGMPFISPNIILVATVNSIGAVFQFVYIAIFIAYAEKTKKLKMSVLLGSVFVIFAAIAFVSLRFMDSHLRQLNLVIKTRSVEYMPLFLSIATFLMSVSFLAYGLLKGDTFIAMPNGIGAILGIVQLGLYYHYSSQFDENSREPLLAEFA